MKIPEGTPQYLAAYLYGALQTTETALHRIADPECEAFHGSRDRVASDALNELRRWEANHVDKPLEENPHDWPAP